MNQLTQIKAWIQETAGGMKCTEPIKAHHIWKSKIWVPQLENSKLCVLLFSLIFIAFFWTAYKSHVYLIYTLKCNDDFMFSLYKQLQTVSHNLSIATVHCNYFLLHFIRETVNVWIGRFCQSVFISLINAKWK